MSRFINKKLYKIALVMGVFFLSSSISIKYSSAQDQSISSEDLLFSTIEDNSQIIVSSPEVEEAPEPNINGISINNHETVKKQHKSLKSIKPIIPEYIEADASILEEEPIIDSNIHKDLFISDSQEETALISDTEENEFAGAIKEVSIDPAKQSANITGDLYTTRAIKKIKLPVKKKNNKEKRTTERLLAPNYENTLTDYVKNSYDNKITSLERKIILLEKEKEYLRGKLKNYEGNNINDLVRNKRNKYK